MKPLFKIAAVTATVLACIAAITIANRHEGKEIKLLPLRNDTSFAYIEDRIKPSVPLDFLNKYPEITDDNLGSFIADWHEWSKQHSNCSRCPDIDTLFWEVRAHYAGKLEKDTSLFTVLDSFNWVNSYSTYSNTYDASNNWLGGCAVTLSLPNNGNTLYLTEEIKNLLFKYIGGVWIEDGKITYRLLDRNPDIAINKEHIANLGKFIPIVRSHWGNYWHFTSMPEIWRIEVFHDGCIVELRRSWCDGETIFIHHTTPIGKKKIELVGYWQE